MENKMGPLLKFSSQNFLLRKIPSTSHVYSENISIMWAEICQDNLCNQKSECMNSWKPNDRSIAIYFTFFFNIYIITTIVSVDSAMQCNVPQVLLKITQEQIWTYNVTSTFLNSNKPRSQLNTIQQIMEAGLFAEFKVKQKTIEAYLF